MGQHRRRTGVKKGRSGPSCAVHDPWLGSARRAGFTAPRGMQCSSLVRTLATTARALRLFTSALPISACAESQSSSLRSGPYRPAEALSCFWSAFTSLTRYELRPRTESCAARRGLTAPQQHAVPLPCPYLGLRSHRRRDMNFARRPIPRCQRGGLTARLQRAAQQLYRSSPK
jgi:hypothetical protein